jgi:2-polyprenyl-3-methyl-5-hydroxy-6-metoxy-1,4-benzoquinol methylase
MTSNLSDQVMGNMRKEIMANLGYFTEWGGRPWENLVRYALQDVGDLHGKRVLEIGPRFGKMSICFALLGAQVVGIETDAAALKRAEQEVKQWNVQANISFFHYDGNIDHCCDLNGSVFDVLFTKSVLVTLRSNLSEFLHRAKEY